MMIEDEDTLYEDNFDENIPYVSLDLDIQDVRLIQECVSQSAELCHHDLEKKENLKYMSDFLARVILEYQFKIE